MAAGQGRAIEILGLVVLKNSEGEFIRDEVKLAMAITDQLGAAIARGTQGNRGKGQGKTG